ncbi:hypothetical protein [Spirosoma pollinicola]|uniref:Uncharacterized protein n=1 Tax=Spirosoma pollinicola TaxID=2057025 RepID=A0A2K8Z2D8_9BACT|nr:hypothetical protein [Spirosoma pollinicola]AUD04028.1 hypothetical protein CWM47_20670 [Spirosoma pollinicola]
MDITPNQRGIMLLVFTGLIGWLIYYWWMLAGGRHPSKRQPTSCNLDNQSNSRLNQALLSLQEFQQQPILESARLNFLRQLDATVLHDLILLALSAVNYVVRMDEPALRYELPPLKETEPNRDFVILDKTEALTKPSYKGRLSRPMKEVMMNLEPRIESGNVFTADGRPVLVSIQLEGNTYSRYGFSRLNKACELENLMGLLIYLGTSPLTSAPVSPVVILTGGELLAILDGLES